jgi:hypothetical protein
MWARSVVLLWELKTAEYIEGKLSLSTDNSEIYRGFCGDCLQTFEFCPKTTNVDSTTVNNSELAVNFPEGTRKLATVRAHMNADRYLEVLKIFRILHNNACIPTLVTA